MAPLTPPLDSMTMTAAAGDTTDLRHRTESQAVKMLRLTQHGLFAAVLLVGLFKGLQGSSPVATTLVALILGAWYLLGLYLERNRRSMAVAIAWLAILSLLFISALVVSADFAWVSFALFVLYASVLPPRWAYLTITVLALATGAVLVLRWPSDRHWAAQFIGPVLGAAAAAGLVSVYRTAAAESRERQRLIDELLATQDSLARANLDAGVRSERERVAAEIHDTLAQGFASVVMLSRQARKAAGAGDYDALAQRLADLERTGVTGLDDARRLVRNLPPQELHAHGLAEAIRILVARSSEEHTGTAAVLRVDGTPRVLSHDVETALLRVAQEGVTNALKHSGARHIVVTLTYGADEVSLDVVDDGRGFDPTVLAPGSRARGGFGLGVMERRVRTLGGTFSLESAPGEGAAVAATVPALPAATADVAATGERVTPAKESDG